MVKICTFPTDEILHGNESNAPTPARKQNRRDGELGRKRVGGKDGAASNCEKADTAKTTARY
ncbi:hypothetical protein JCM10003_1324 [Bacteroides pyogenes JCM 10003]|nr:hypothetical protein JCM10003_1324 [Bacteroides pyogenes JCM 10003]